MSVKNLSSFHFENKSCQPWLLYIFSKWNNNKNLGWHLVFSIKFLVISLSNKKNNCMTMLRLFVDLKPVSIFISDVFILLQFERLILYLKKIFLVFTCSKSVKVHKTLQIKKFEWHEMKLPEIRMCLISKHF